MEENTIEASKEEQASASLTISKEAINSLTETAKWTKFLSILGFIFIGLIVVMAFFAGSMMSFLPTQQIDQMPNSLGFLFTVIYLLMALLYFFPTKYLWNFSQMIKSALANQNEEELDAALSNQKSFYKFFGILIIVFLSIYAFTGLTTFLIFLLK